MVSRRSVKIKSTSVLKKLKKRIGSKPKNSVGVQDVNLKRAANSQIEMPRDQSRTRRSSTTENKQKENRSSGILTRKRKNVPDQDDSRVKSCTVLAVKLKYPYVGRTTSVKLNSRNTNKHSDSSRTVSRTTAKSPETDLVLEGNSRKSSRMRKPTTKELRSVLTSAVTKSGLDKHNGEMSPQKPRSKTVKSDISGGTSTPNQRAQAGKVTDSGKNVTFEKKVKDDMECVRCGLTPSQFFGEDLEHNTVCCFCSLVKPPQELTALLQLLKLDCCLKFLNQKNQGTVESSIASSRKRRMSEHNAQAGGENTSNSNSYMKTLRERNATRNQKEQHNQNSPEEQKKNTGPITRPVRQQKVNSSVNLNKVSNTAKSPNSAAISSTRISTRLMEKTVSREKPSTKANSKQTISTIKDIHTNLKRKISPQSEQNPTKRRKLTENAEKKTAKEHICNSCNSSFAMQWKLKLHELTHADKSHPNVVLRHTEVENTSDVTDQNMEVECSEAMDCVPNNEDSVDKENLDVQISETAVQQINSTLEMQEDKTNLANENSKENPGNESSKENSCIENSKENLGNENSKEGGDDLKHTEALKQGNVVKSHLEDNQEIVNKDNSNDIQNREIKGAKISDTLADRENTEVNQKTDGLDLHTATTNCEVASNKDNIEVNVETKVPAKCDENPTLNKSTGQSTKTKEDASTKKPDLSSSSEDTNAVSASEDKTDKEQDKRKLSGETADNENETAEENESIVEKSKPLDTILTEDAALVQSELQNTVEDLDKVCENFENAEKSEETGTIIKDEKTQPHALGEVSKDEHSAEESEERSNVGDEDIVGEQTEMPENENSKIDEMCSEENISLKNNSDHLDQIGDESLDTEEGNNSENPVKEQRSEVEKIETKPTHCDGQHKADLSKNSEIKVNGTITNDGSRSASESQNTSRPEIAVNHAVDNNNSEQPADESLNELYNQMNIIFEDQTADENKVKKPADHQLENGGDNSSESKDQRKHTENEIKSQE